MSAGRELAIRTQLMNQSRDLAPRGKGSKAARRLRKKRDDDHLRGLTRRNRTQSRAQQRLLFAKYGDAARQWTTAGRYARLPEHKPNPGGPR